MQEPQSKVNPSVLKDDFSSRPDQSKPIIEINKPLFLAHSSLELPLERNQDQMPLTNQD